MTWQARLEAAKTEVARRRVVTLAAAGELDQTADSWWTDGLSWHIAYDGLGRSVAEHIAHQDPAHVLEVLEIHRLILALADPWLMNRLDQPGPITDPVRALIDLYAKETADA